MKRAFIILFILSICFPAPGFTKEQAEKVRQEEPVSEEVQQQEETPELPSIFIWQLPDETEQAEDDDILEEAEEETLDAETAEGEEGEEISLSPDDITVKGYLEYTEGAEAIYLKDDNKDLVLNLRVPQKFETTKATDLKKLPATTFSQNVYARSGDIAYNIAPVDAGASVSKGHFSIGTSYNESIDTSDLGFTTSFYTKYDRKYFSLSSAYNKESGVAYSMVVDKFSFTPELKLNKYVSIKDVMTTDITRNRKENSLILSIKPTSDDRVRFEFGAGQTYDENSALIKSQVKFSTQYKW